MSEKKTPTLFKKLIKVLDSVSKVKKSGYNSHQKYHYVTEADLLDAVRSELINQNVFIFTSVVDAKKEGNITTVITEHTFVDGDSGESFTVRSAGQGADSQDKGIFKAQTGAFKYLLMKNFLLSSGDDPENDGATVKATVSSNVTAPQLSKTESRTTSKLEDKPTFKMPVKKATEEKVEPKF